MFAPTSNLILAIFVAVLVAMTTAIPCVHDHDNNNNNNKCPLDTDSDAETAPMYYTHPDDCNKYYECVKGKPQVRSCCPNTVFNDQLDKCVTPGSPDDNCTRYNPIRECEKGSVDLIPHPTACQRYFNCSDTQKRSMYTKFGRFEQECSYPDVFDVNQKTCVHFERATCGEGRVAAKWKCDYLQYQCPVAHCRPCYVDNPSCVGEEDGLMAHPYRMWSPYFIECKSERHVNTSRCPVYRLPRVNMTQLFNPDDRRCAPLWEVPREHSGYRPSCEAQAPGYHTLAGMEFIAYTCPEISFFYCHPPLSVNEDIGRCQAL